MQKAEGRRSKIQVFSLLRCTLYSPVALSRESEGRREWKKLWPHARQSSSVFSHLMGERRTTEVLDTTVGAWSLEPSPVYHVRKRQLWNGIRELNKDQMARFRNDKQSKSKVRAFFICICILPKRATGTIARKDSVVLSIVLCVYLFSDFDFR